MALLLLGCTPSPQAQPQPGANSVSRSVDSPTANDRVAEKDLAPPTRGESVLLYQGFDHEWRRSLVGLHVPHRIGGFVSYLERDEESSSSHRAEGLFHLGQKVGVNADFMKPSGFHTAVYHPQLRVERGVTTISFTDEMPPGDDPSVDVKRQTMLEVDLPTGAEQEVAVALLQGVALAGNCDPTKQPAGKKCGSNAMWLTHFRVDIGECSQEGSHRQCPVNVEVGRAWTPDRGGFMGIMSKAVEARLDVVIEVHWALLSAPAEALTVTRVPPVEFEGRARETEPMLRSVTVRGTPIRGPSVAQVGVTGFHFELFARTSTPRSQRTGRYIDRWGFGVRRDAYQGEIGEIGVAFSSQLRVPATVADSGVRNEVSVATLQLRGPDAWAATSGRAVGSICEGGGSPEETWRPCQSFPWGPERTEDTVVVRVAGGAPG